MKKLGQVWFKDTQRGCLYQVIAVLIVVPLFCLLVIVPLYFANRPGVSSTESLWIMVAPMSLFFLLLVGGGFLAVFISIRRRAAWLDQVLRDYNLEGRSYTIIGRQYHGTLRGRKVDILFRRGPTFLIYLSTPLKTQLTISEREAVSTTLASGLNVMPVAVKGLEDFYIVANEEAWARGFLSEPEVAPILQNLLLDEANPFFIKQVVLNPGYLQLNYYRTTKMWDVRFEDEDARLWINQLLRFLDIAESQPAPTEELEASQLAETIRSGKINTGAIAAVVVFLLVVVPLCLAGLIIAMLAVSGAL